MGMEHYLCFGVGRRYVAVVSSESSRFRRIDRPRKVVIVRTGEGPDSEGKFCRRLIGEIAIKVELPRLIQSIFNKTEITSQGIVTQAG